jgi:DNA-binding response OmpR family regulator
MPRSLLLDHADARVLIVDFREAELLERLLVRHGITRIETASDPRDVLDGIPDFDPDLVLLDLFLPYVDGFTMLRRFRERAGEAYLPVVALTADTAPATLLRAVESGATDFLVKPFNATEIMIRVRNLLVCRSLYLEVRRHTELAAAGRPLP